MIILIFGIFNLIVFNFASWIHITISFSWLSSVFAPFDHLKMGFYK